MNVTASAPDDDSFNEFNEMTKNFFKYLQEKNTVVTVPALYNCDNGKVIYRHDSIPSEYLRIFTNGFN